MTVSDRDARIIEECRETDEPCIVFRAQDRHSVGVIQGYLEMLSSDSTVTGEFLDAVSDRIYEFENWQDNPANHVKSPDLRKGESHTSP